METSAFGAATSAIARRSFDATISTLDAETSSLDAETSSLDAETSVLDAETSALDTETSALGAETSALGAVTSTIARSYRRYRRGVSGDIGDCGVGITPQMCNRVTNHGDMSTFSKPDCGDGWKLRRIAGEARNMTENALSILSVIFFRTTPTNRDLREKVVYFPPWLASNPPQLPAVRGGK